MLKARKSVLIVLAISLSFATFSHNVAQERSVSQIGCALIDRSRPAQFISYENTSDVASEVTLRLHNNTSCSIIVETDDRNPTRVVKLPDGGIRIETVTTSQDGIRLPLHYLVQDKGGRKRPETAYGWGDSVYNFEILAGQSAVFTVPLTHFRKQLNVVVPFNYTWQGDRPVGRGIGGLVHLVYFLVDDVPETVLRRRR